MSDKCPRPVSRDCFEIAIICALPLERIAIEALLDEEYETNGFSYGKAEGDLNTYTFGRLGKQDVVLAYMPGLGMVSAAATAANIGPSFPNIKVGLLVGVCGGVPRTNAGVEIFLGDIIISLSVIQTDFGRKYPNKVIRKQKVENTLKRANPRLQEFGGKISQYAVRQRLQEKTHSYAAQISAKDEFFSSAYPGAENDRLYPPEHRHKHWRKASLHEPCICDRCRSLEDDVCEVALQSNCEDIGCDDCLSMEDSRTQRTGRIAPLDSETLTAEMQSARKPIVHIGRIACGNTLINSVVHRDQIAAQDGVIGFEMEAAGIWDYLPTIVIKSVCDYADGHKDGRWLRYAATTAAACTKAVLEEWSDTTAKMVKLANLHTDSVRASAPFTIPFRRNEDFVECEALCNQITERCSASGSRIVLTGLGGIGKSQIAIECAYRIREQSPGTSIFWIDASSVARFEQSFQEIAREARISAQSEPRADILLLVFDWLRYHCKGKTMLILDDFCDTILLEAHHDPQICNRNWQPLLDYIAHDPNGSILITTRDRNAAMRFVEPPDIIQIQPMNPASALALLQKRLGMAWKMKDNCAATKLVVALEYMPLAIVQAAAYISQKSPRYSVQRYLEQFMSNGRIKKTLPTYDGGKHEQDEEVENPVIVTWQISFSYIHQARPSAADLLSLISFFDKNRIPMALLRNQSLEYLGNNEESSGSSVDSDSHDGLEEDIAMLRNHSFISIHQDCTAFEMHGLVQLAIRKLLEANGKAEMWKQKAIKNLCAAFPTGEHKNWAINQALFPHIRSLALQQPKKVEGLRDWASLLHRAARYALGSGNANDAIIMLTNSMKARKLLFGNSHEHMLDSLEMLGSAYSLIGSWKRAEELQEQVMETRMKVLGAEHPDTLISMNNLALAYWNQGRWAEAEELEVQVMKTRMKVFGPEHPDTLTSMNNLALTFWNQGRWAEAERLEVQVMETRMKVFGPEHPDTLTSMNNLALTYWNQGEWTEAEALFVQVIGTRKRVLGAEHPNTLTSIAHLASTYRSQGRWEEAERLEVQLMKTRKTKLGADHPDTLTSIANLASTYRNQGRWQEAEQLEVHVMDVSKTKLGADHPDTLSSMTNLASTYRNQGRWREAEELEAQVMETRKRVLGEEHPDTLTSMGNLASTYMNQGRLKAAEELEVQVMETFKRVLGAEHPDTLSSMTNLASTYRNQGRWKEAEELEVQVMETFKRVLGVQHPATLTSMTNLASTYRIQGRWNEAEELDVQVMEMRMRVLGAEHPDTLTSMNNLAFTWKGLSRDAEAIQLMRECVERRINILGGTHPHFLSSITMLRTWEAERSDISTDAAMREDVTGRLSELRNRFKPYYT